MSDNPEDTSPEKEDKPKQLRGFANPANRKNINKRGRPRASTKKVPKMSEIEDMILCGNKEAVALMMKFIRNDDASDAVRLKAACKVNEEANKIEEKRLREKAEKAFEKELEREEKATGTHGGGSAPKSNVRFLNPKFNKKDEDESEEGDD